MLIIKSISSNATIMDNIIAQIKLSELSVGNPVSIFYSVDKSLPKWISTFIPTEREQEESVVLPPLPLGKHTIRFFAADTAKDGAVLSKDEMKYISVNAAISDYISGGKMSDNAHILVSPVPITLKFGA